MDWTLLGIEKTEYHKETVYCYTFFWEGMTGDFYRKITQRMFKTVTKGQ